MATLMQKNIAGKALGRSTKECSAMYRDLEIKWDYENNIVQYGRTYGFNLKTGECCICSGSAVVCQPT